MIQGYEDATQLDSCRIAERNRAWLRTLKLGATVSLLLLGLTSCGSDNDEETDGGSGVNSVSLDNSALSNAGGAAIASVKFSFSSDDVFDDDRNVVVGIELPAVVKYRSGTGEVKRPIDDREVDPEISICDDGRSFVVFDLDEEDLITAENPSGDADAELRFTIDAVAPGGPSSINVAAANDTLLVGCTAGIATQQSALVSVN